MGASRFFLSKCQSEDDAGATSVRIDFNLRSTSMANVTKHMNASPPMTPPTIAPVLLLELADASGTLVFGCESRVEEVVIKAGMEMAAVEEIAEEEDDGR